MLIKAQRPVIYAGQGVHWASAYQELRELAELLAIPVCTSLPGKSCFDETHPLALGSGGNAHPKAVPHFLRNADVIFGIGCSFSETAFGIAIPSGESGEPGSPHYTDLTRAWVTGRLQPLPFSRAAVRRSAADTLVLNPR